MSEVKKCLSEEELSSISGGKPQTGDFNDENKVYIVFPFPFSSMSKYYGVQDVEDLAEEYFSMKDTIKTFITPAIKTAIQNLYDKNNATMSDKVLAFFG